jgi:hypothetical protein
VERKIFFVRKAHLRKFLNGFGNGEIFGGALSFGGGGFSSVSLLFFVASADGFERFLFFVEGFYFEFLFCLGGGLEGFAGNFLASQFPLNADFRRQTLQKFCTSQIWKKQ